MIIIAIDPGKNGGLAGHNSNAENSVFSFGFANMTESDIIREFKAFREIDPHRIAVIEDLQKFSPQPAAKMAVYACSYGILKGALLALEYRIHVVRSRKWQADLSLGEKGKMTSSQWKRKLRAAQERFPGHAITMQTADALLILEWAKLKIKGGLEV